MNWGSHGMRVPVYGIRTLDTHKQCIVSWYSMQTLHTVSKTLIYNMYTLHTSLSIEREGEVLYQLSYRDSSAGWAQISHLIVHLINRLTIHVYVYMDSTGVNEHECIQ